MNVTISKLTCTLDWYTKVLNLFEISCLALNDEKLGEEKLFTVKERASLARCLWLFCKLVYIKKEMKPRTAVRFTRALVSTRRGLWREIRCWTKKKVDFSQQPVHDCVDGWIKTVP